MERIFFTLFFLFAAFAKIIAHDSVITLEQPISYIHNSVNVITGAYNEIQNDLKISGRFPIQINRMFESGHFLHPGWRFNHPGILSHYSPNLRDLQRPDHCVHYEYDADKRLACIKTTNKGNENVYNWVRFDYTMEAQKTLCTLQTNAGDQLTYSFQSFDASKLTVPLLLTEVRRAGNLLCSYSYTQCGAQHLISRRERPEGRYLINEYYDEGDHAGKIKAQYAPVGVDSAPVLMYRFVYHPGWTEVYNANDSKTIYRYDELQRLSAIEQFLDDQFYRSERFYWDAEGRLIARALLDGKGSPVISKTFEYDAKGQLTKKTLYGNLSGKGETLWKLQSNGFPTGTGLEHYSSVYTYSNDETPLLISQKEDNGTYILYYYDQKTHALITKLICDEEGIRIRHFFSYDENNALVKTIIDDGNSADSENLTGVTERHLTTVAYRKEHPGMGLPETIEESVLDLESGKEKLIKRTHNVYSAKEDLIHQTVFDDAGNVETSICYNCDDIGRRISQKDAKGVVTEFVYDANGNLIRQCERDSNGHSSEILNEFDYANRCIRRENSTSEGYVQSSSFTYDSLGNQTAMTDGFGNTTHSMFDALGRRSSILHPEVLNERDQLVRHEELQEYDICDCITLKTDANGFTTSARYNARGKPTEIHYPDGTQERFEYCLDGSLRQALARNGIRTVYTHDYLARVIRTEEFDANGILFSSTSAVYNPFRKISSTDASGVCTEYPVGQFETPVTHENDQQDTHVSSNNPPQTIYDYTQNVLKISVTDHSGLTTQTTINPRNQIEKIIKLNRFGQVISRQEMRYDGLGNKILEKHGDSFSIAWKYGPCNRLEKVVEAYGSPNQRQTSYQYDDKGQLLAIIKPDGVWVTYHYDAAGRLELLNSSDKSVCYQYAYDDAGRISSVEDLVYQTIFQRIYNPSGQLEHEVLGNGLAISNAFDPSGRRTKVILPDGSGINYEFDSDVLQAVHRVDAMGACMYTHSYSDCNEWGQVLKAQLIGGLGEIRYSYDASHRLVGMSSPFYSETVPEDGYDPAGNLTRIDIHDPLGIHAAHYTYDDQNQLISEEGSAAHDYQYDGTGNVYRDDLQMHFDERLAVTQCGDTYFRYNANGCPIEKRTQNETITYEYDALDRLIGVCNNDRQAFKYTYDAFNRRLSKKSFVRDESSKKWIEVAALRFLYDGRDDIGAANSEGTLVELKVPEMGQEIGLGQSVAIELDGIPYAPFHDRRGSVTCLVDLKTGAPAETYRYSAFGEMQGFDSIGQSIEKSMLDNPWNFSGKRYDVETGLIYFGARFYDPSLGRWMTPDPAGFIDGPNRFAYVNNNPVNGIDPHGLFSLSGFWNSVTSLFWQGANAFMDAIYTITNYMHSRFSYSNYAQAEIDYTANQIFGQTFLEVAGYYTDPGHVGICGSGEYSDKVRITAINGILNLHEHCLDAVQLISRSHGGTNVHYVFYPTYGWTWDIVKSFMVKCGYISPEAYQLANTWKELIKEMGGIEGGGRIIHYAHSIGGTNTATAKKLLSAEELRMIRVITIGSATMVPTGGFESVVNYVSIRDGVSFLDPLGHYHNSNIVYLGSLFGIPLVDHFLITETYQRLLAYLGRQFLERER